MVDISQKILSDITVFNKYAKYVPELGRRENWEELCIRNMEMHCKRYPELTWETKKVYKDFVYPKKILFDGRKSGGTLVERTPGRYPAKRKSIELYCEYRFDKKTKECSIGFDCAPHGAVIYSSNHRP